MKNPEYLRIINSEYFEHDFGMYSLHGRILYNGEREDPWVFSVHGARSDFAKSDTVTIGLRDRGFSILGFNMSGHNSDSKIPLEQTTLGNNVLETETFYSYLSHKRKKNVVAYSLGATLALKLLYSHADEIDTFVLFGPAIFSTHAYDKHFGREFKNTISTPFSYRENDVISSLKSFKGKLLIVKGEFDGLDPVAYGKPVGTSVGKFKIGAHNYYSPIPKEVIEKIFDAVSPGRRKMMIVPGSDHGVVPWIKSHPAEGASIMDKIADFMTH